MNPVVLIFGSEFCDINSVIKDITGQTASELPEPVSSTEFATCYPWLIDNKYYSADVNLCKVIDKKFSDEQLLQRCEAVLIFFDSEQANGLDWADTVHSICAQSVDSCAGVCLLVCGKCDHESAVSQQKAQQWCVGHGYELIELDNCSESNAPETSGVERIIEALHAHTWSNLTLKGSVATESRADHCNVASGLISPVGNITTTDTGDSSNGDNDAAASGDHTLLEQFEELFGRLASMHMASEGMSRSQRHLFAEKMATQFMQALGDDEDSGDDK